jgi:hypothetical protein
MTNTNSQKPDIKYSDSEDLKIKELQDQVYCLQHSLATLRQDIPELVKEAIIAALNERNRRSWIL